jgi:flagellar biogenesis protein FliO
MTITSLLIPLLVVIVWMLIWAVRKAMRQFRSGEPMGVKYSVVLLSSGTSLGFIWCYAFYIFAGLGHSSHPLADVWFECLIGIIIFLILPIAFLAWCHYRIGREMSSNVKREKINSKYQ